MTNIAIGVPVIEAHRSQAPIPQSPQRLGLEGQQVFSIFGENLGYVVGTSTSGKSWKLSTGIPVLNLRKSKTRLGVSLVI